MPSATWHRGRAARRCAPRLRLPSAEIEYSLAKPPTMPRTYMTLTLDRLYNTGRGSRTQNSFTVRAA